MPKDAHKHKKTRKRHACPQQVQEESNAGNKINNFRQNMLQLNLQFSRALQRTLANAISVRVSPFKSAIIEKRNYLNLKFTDVQLLM